MVVSAIFLAACQPADTEPERPGPEQLAQLNEQAAQLTGQFIATLQPTLQQAMQAGGPVNAIEVCAEAAPAIAASLGETSGWQVRRVSLRARNRQSAVPDEWETAVLHEFDSRQAAGEPGEQINESRFVDGEFRYMQAQVVGPLCLACHGTEIVPEVQSALQAHYPDDAATGYVAGQIRGAISLRTAP